MQWHRRQARRMLPPGSVEALRAVEARVRPDFRRAVVYGVVAVAAIVAERNLGGIHAATVERRIISWALAGVVAVFGVLATQSAGNEVARITQPRAGPSAAAALRIITLLVGYLVVVSAVLNMLELPLGRYVAVGSITAIILGIAGQQVLGNLFAGFVLLFSRPYVPGERIRILSGAIGGPHVGVVTAVGLLYTQLLTEEGRLNIPNSALLAAAVGPVDDDAHSGDAEPDEDLRAGEPEIGPDDPPSPPTPPSRTEGGPVADGSPPGP